MKVRSTKFEVRNTKSKAQSLNNGLLALAFHASYFVLRTCGLPAAFRTSSFVLRTSERFVLRTSNRFVLRTCDRRKAITLLEVLMSMFVLAVGLLSVASLLPVGSFQAARALIDDRKAVLGQNAAREAKTRGVLRPDWWRYVNGLPYVVQTPKTSGTTTIPAGTLMDPINGKAINEPPNATNSVPLPPVCVDPWMFNMALKNKYSALQMGFVNLFASANANSPLKMARVTLVQSPLNTAIALASSAAYDQCVVSEDDLAYALDQSNPDTPPVLGFNGNGLPAGLGLKVGTAAATGTKRNYNGQFTWAATLVPLYGDGVQRVNRNLMQLSVVVFSQRVALPTATPSGVTERAALAVFKPANGGTQLYPPDKSNSINKFGSAGIGAAEIQIADLSSPSNTTKADADLAVKPGEWIMLGTMITEYNPYAPVFKDKGPTGNTIQVSPSDMLGWDNTQTPPIPPSRPMFRWYKVVAVGPLLAPGKGDNPLSGKYYVRDLTISGPEWNMSSVADSNILLSAPHFIHARDPKGNPQFFAFIYDGAVAVYERTVRLEGPSMWSN
jgi:hypothetical protein